MNGISVLTWKYVTTVSLILRNFDTLNEGEMVEQSPKTS